MSILTYRKGWSNKPPVGAQLNWGHPLTRGLVAAYLYNEGAGLTINDLLLRNPGVMSNTPSSGQGGAWQNIPGSPAVAGTSGNFRNNFPGGPVTLLNIYGQPTALSIVGQFYARSDQGHFNPIVDWGTSGGNGVVQLQFDFNNIGSGIDGAQAIPGDARFVTYGTDGQFQQQNVHVVFVDDPGGTVGPAGLSLYFNGILVGFTALTAPIDWVDSLPSPNIFMGHSTNGNIGQVLLYTRALTAGEAQMLYVDPYCIVSPQSGRVRSSGLPIPVMPPLIGNLLMPPRPHALVRM